MSEEEKPLTKFELKLREKRAAEAAAAARKETAQRVSSAGPVWDDDLIPGSDTSRTDTDKELDRILGSIGIIEAYHRWCGKMKVDGRRRTVEGIKVSCPIPGHADSNPSAWINTDKNLWNCGRCGQGGDVYDLAAFHYGFKVPGYKEGGNFLELRYKMAGSYGYTFMTPPGLNKPIMIPPESAKAAMGPPVVVPKLNEPEPPDDADTAQVIAMIDDDEPDQVTTLDWRKLVASDTFLDKYMHLCIEDDAPEEYHFWNGILALGLAVGRDVVLSDQKPVLANLFLCLLGPTGDRKSRSHAHVDDLLYKAMPYRIEDVGGKGVDIIDSPASAEALIAAYVNPIYDPTDPKRIAGYAPVKGLIKFDELSSLVGRASRKGNVLKPTLMSFYDGSRVISTMSMTHGKKKAENPFGSLFTTTQPKALKTLLREEDASSGFLNRIVFATGTSKKLVAIGGKKIDITPAVLPLQEVQGWAGFGRMVLWSDDAIKTFTEFFHDVLHPAQQEDETGLLNRMDLLAKKMILLLCINEHTTLVTADMVEKVIGMFPYLTAAYGVPAAHIGSTVNSEVRDELMRHIDSHTKKSGGITMRRLMANLKRKNYPLEVVSKTIKYLTDLGFIEVQASQGVGRPTVKYRTIHD